MISALKKQSELNKLSQYFFRKQGINLRSVVYADVVTVMSAWLMTLSSDEIIAVINEYDEDNCVRYIVTPKYYRAVVERAVRDKKYGRAAASMQPSASLSTGRL